MDVVEIPILQSFVGPEEALQRMRQYNRSAVVVQTGTARRLLEAGQVFRGLAQGAVSLEEVAGGVELYAPNAQVLAESGADVQDPFATYEVYETLLDRAGSAFGILGTARDMAFVLTRHEGLGARLGGGPANCYCTVCEAPAPGKNSGDKCNLCDGTIYCRP